MEPRVEKPTLLYDGACSFCRLWIERWRGITCERVQYLTFQEAQALFHEIPRKEFSSAVELVLPGGEAFRAAHAVFRALAFAPGRAWMLWLYQNLPGAAPAAELLYSLVARNRNFLYRLMRLFWGKRFERPVFGCASWLFLRLLGAVYFFAFLSLAAQITGLIGRHGILPAGEFLDAVRARYGGERYWLFPTLAWLSSSDTALRTLSGAGVAGSLLLIFDIAPMLVLSLLWVLYLSLVTVGQDFLAFQWDNLLLEAGFLAIFLTPWHLWPRAPAKTRSSRGARWMLWFLLFRLMFSSGVVKLASGDPAWRKLTALEFHYYTQPLPTPVAWYVHLAPTWFHHGSAAMVFCFELAVPFLIFAPRLWRFAGAGLLILLQVLIALTGNYAFFNLLSIALCLLLIDDAFLERIVPRRRAASGNGSVRNPCRRSIRRFVTAPILMVIFLAGLSQLAAVLQIEWVPSPAGRFLSYLEPVRVVNSYGLFAVMTTSRPEIVIEGSNDGNTWRDYEFKFKPGNLGRAPRWIEPFQPRLDWQMWFAALGDYRASPWFSHLIFQLLNGSPPVLALLAHNPFPRSPPRYLRALIYDYYFTNWPERRADGEWWHRRLIGSYVPTVSLNVNDDPR